MGAAMIVGIPLQAQETSATAKSPTWYMGIDGGVPFGYSTFRSFGADKTRPGFDAGVFGGYRFSPLLSLEVSARMGKLGMSATDCCILSGYWLGQDGRHYHVPALGLEGWNYGDLKSDVRMQEYALQFNVNLLGLWSKTKNSPWAVEVSPRLGASLTQTDIKTIGDNALHIKGGNRWHLAAGGRLQVSRTIGKHFLAGVYTGMTFLTGRGIDNMPRHIHRSNYVWDSGVRIGYLLGRRTKKPKAAASTENSVSAPIAGERTEETTIQQPAPVQPADTVVIPDTATVPDAAAVSAITDIAMTAEATDTLVTFPVIYFGFDKYTVATTETAKLQEILSLLQQRSDVQVQIHGYCDRRGTAAYNSPLSLRRAESVKNWLTEHGIPAERISTAGYGIDRTTTDNRHARRAVIIQLRKEESK